MTELKKFTDQQIQQENARRRLPKDIEYALEELGEWITNGILKIDEGKTTLVYEDDKVSFKLDLKIGGLAKRKKN